MASNEPRSLIDRAVGAALSILVAALALYIAAKLIAAFLTILLVAVAVGLFIGIVVLILRHRGW
jgi:hypothetical protein